MAGAASSLSRRDRALSLTAVALVHGAIGWILIAGLAPHWRPVVDRSLAAFDVTPPLPSPATPAEMARRAPDPEGAAASPALRATPKPVVAPVPIVPPPPPPLLAAPVAADGAAATSGAAPLPGPGTGAGGVGEGRGAGRWGGGTGGGGAGRRSRKIAGDIAHRDYPRAVSKAGRGGDVTAMFTVGTDGRVRGCRVSVSSGIPDLDAATCRLIEARFRYEPARDPAGRPVEEARGWRQRWWLESD